MKPGWYILNYHEISWEESAYTRAIGGNFPPDVFHSHLQALSEHAHLVSVPEGLAQFRAGKLSQPLVSFWFDDGLAGVRRYALPLMEQFGVKGAMSVCSKFMLRQELFWRFKLSFLTRSDGMRFLRSRLRALGYSTGDSVRAFTLDHFSAEVLAAIDAVYEQFTREQDRADAFRLFDDVAGIAALGEAGWEIANHSASHYPVSEDSFIGQFAAEYERCELALHEHLGLESRFWVIPFDRQGRGAAGLLDTFARTDDAERTLVRVGGAPNREQQENGRVLHRIYPPYEHGPGLVRFLSQL